VSIAEESTAAKIDHQPNVSTGVGIAIAAIWVSVSLLLGFLAWLAVTQIHIKSGWVEVEERTGFFLGFGYILVVIFVLGFAALTTAELIRHKDN
jgi:hypothetical protein